ncbi:MAG: HK97 family phage prohead protease [Prevotellaceae bacterium]|jgi:HK97 family phage prohead protease|nr:HK97 family phage prohead protease [Prevotellaceae bacterium]
MKREIRNTVSNVKVTGEEGEESRSIEGYAMLFDTPSTDLSFEEIVERGALDDVLGKSDVFAFLNHDSYRGVLARWKRKAGSLILSVDQKGLKYEFDAPKTALGDELIENIKRGEIDSSSFSFTVEKDTWGKKDNGTWKRTINKIERLYDVSPVYNPAYKGTSVYMRGAEDDAVITPQSLIEQREKELMEAEKQRTAAKEQLEHNEAIAAYLKKIESGLNKF